MIDKIKKFLITWDTLWSIPFAGLLLFIVTGVLIKFFPNADVLSIGAIIQDNFTAAWRLLVSCLVAQVGVIFTIMLPFQVKISDIQKSLKGETSSWLALSCLLLYVALVIAFQLAIP